METLIAVAHHRNQYYGGCRMGNSPMNFSTPPLNGFRGVNCRAFEAGVGLLPSPNYVYGSPPVSTRGLLPRNPPTPRVPVGVRESKSEVVRKSKRFVSSSSIPIAINFEGRGGSLKGRKSMEDVSSSERWAGPAYSNSPPPSSVPMPKFDMKTKRTVSLDLPAFVSELNLDLPPMSKSAPTSPTSQSSCSSVDFFSDDDSATKTLRRILNLDVVED